MKRRGLSLAAACGALALVLASEGESHAQTSVGRNNPFGAPIGVGRGFGAVGYYPGGLYGVGPYYNNGYNPGYYYNGYANASSPFYNPPYYTPPYTRYASTVYNPPLYNSSGYYGGGYYGTETPSLRPLTYVDYSAGDYRSFYPKVTDLAPPDKAPAADAPNTGGAVVKVDVRVPADAELWFEGQKTNQTGAERTFQSPPLEPGQKYVYDVRARWKENGKEVEQTRKVRVRAGERVTVDFTKPDSNP
jgi:uncharacterized protein (TIGR03000 family)